MGLDCLSEVDFQPPIGKKNRRNIIYKYIPGFCGNCRQILVAMGRPLKRVFSSSQPSAQFHAAKASAEKRSHVK